MPTLLLVALGFAGAFVAAAVATTLAWALIRRRLPSEPLPLTGSLAADGDPALLRMQPISSISLWAELLARFDCVDSMRRRMSEAGLNWSVGRLAALMLLAAAVTLAVAWKLRWVPTWAMLLATPAAGFVPYGLVLHLRQRRLAKLEEQLPDALDSLARSLRAGHPLLAGLEMLAAEAPQPLRGEMRHTCDERRLGRNWDQALENLAGRVPLLDYSTFVAALRLQSKTGGKLSDVLARLAESMREAVALRAEIRAIAAHGKMTGQILAVLPVFIAAMMTYVNPSYMRVLLDHPHGQDLIAAAAGSLLLAALIMRKMVDIRP